MRLAGEAKNIDETRRVEGEECSTVDGASLWYVVTGNLEAESKVMFSSCLNPGDLKGIRSCNTLDPLQVILVINP